MSLGISVVFLNVAYHLGQVLAEPVCKLSIPILLRLPYLDSIRASFHVFPYFCVGYVENHSLSAVFGVVLRMVELMEVSQMACRSGDSYLRRMLPQSMLKTDILLGGVQDFYAKLSATVSKCLALCLGNGPVVFDCWVSI